jgi:hypothetical protein
MTESHPIQQSSGIKCSIEMIDGAFQNLSPAINEVDIKHTTVLMQEEF